MSTSPRRNTTLAALAAAMIAVSAWAALTLAGDDRELRSGTPTSFVTTSAPHSAEHTVRTTGPVPIDTAPPAVATEAPSSTTPAFTPAAPAEEAPTETSAPFDPTDAEGGGDVPVPGAGVPPTFVTEEDTTAADDMARSQAEAEEEAARAAEAQRTYDDVNGEPFAGPPQGEFTPRGNEGGDEGG